MSRGKSLALALVVGALLQSVAFADLDAAEKKWVRQCVEALGAKSDRARLGAEEALVKVGPDAVAGILAALDTVKTDEHWASLQQALLRMGPMAGNSLEKAKAQWPKPHAERLAKALELIKSDAAVEKQDPAVDKKVRELLAQFDGKRSFMIPNPQVKAVIAMGRPAVPTLLAILAEEAGIAIGVGKGAPVTPAEGEPAPAPGDDPFGPDGFPSFPGSGFRKSAASYALRELATEADIPRIARVLHAGVTEAARALGKLNCRPVLDALLTAVEKDIMDFTVAEELERYASDPRVAEVVVRWHDANAREGGHRVAASATVLGETASAAAADVLVRHLAAARDDQTLWRVGEALAKLGRKEGIEALIRVFADEVDPYGPRAAAPDMPPDGMPGGLPPFGAGIGSGHRTSAGMMLNRISGRRLFTGSNVVRPGMDRENIAAADAGAKAAAEWWAGAKSKITFDPQTRKWSSQTAGDE